MNNYATNPFPTDEDEMMNRDLASPQFATWTLRSEASRVMEIANHLYPDTEIQDLARAIFHLAQMLDDKVDKQP
jgi:hypothetical protein